MKILKALAVLGIASLLTISAHAQTLVKPSQGGTGIGSYSIGDIIYASASNILSKLGIGADGTCLKVFGGLPVWGTCGGGGSGGGTFSTTTSTVSGQLINYPNNTTDIVNIGSNSTTTGEFYFDPNAPFAKLGSQLLVTGSTTLQNFTGVNATTTQATSTNLAITSLSSELLKVNANGSVLEAVSGTDYSNFGTSVGPTELEATDFGHFTCNGTTCSLDANTVGAGALDESANFTFNGTITSTGASTFDNITRSTTTAATTTNLFSTTASSTNLYTTNFTFGGVTGSAWSTFCISITGSAGLCDGSDDGAGSSASTTLLSDSNTFSGLNAFTNSGTTSFAGGIATTRIDTSATSTLAGLRIDSGGLQISTLNCSGLTNGGTLTTDASGNVTCADDDGGAGGLTSYDAWTHPSAGVSATTSSMIFNNASSTFTGNLNITGNSTTTNATTTSLFSTAITATTGFFTNLFIGADTLAEYISDIAGAFFTGNTETGITVTYQDADNTVDVVCDTANGSTFGCLSAADWTTFNNKQATISSTWPITLSGVTLSWGGLATTSSPTAGNLFYSNGTNGLVPVATSSITINSPLTSAGTAGYVVGGSGWTLDVSNIANSDLANSTISGVSLGSNLNALTNDTTLVGSSYNGSAAVSDWGIDLTSQNIWTGASTTFVNGVTMGNSTSTNATTTNFAALNTTSALGLFDANGSLTEYTGSACGGTDQVTGISAVGVVTCSAQGSGGGGANSKWATSTGPFTNAIYPNGTGGNTLVGIGTSTPAYQLTVSSSTASQLALTDGSLTSNQFAFRNAGGILYLATSSPSTFATSTNALFTINGTTGDVSFGSGTTGISLNPIGSSYFTNSLGVGTTTPYAKLSVVGETVSAYFTATTSSISTFPSLTSTNATTTGTFALPVGTSPNVSVAGQCAIDTTSGQLKCHTGSEVDVFVAERFPIFSYSTTTWTAGTTTLKIGPASLAQTWKNVRCDSNNFIGVSIYDGTNRMNYFVASSTIGTVTLSTNNSFTAGEARRVDFGTSTTISSPVSISCTGTYGIDAD